MGAKAKRGPKPGSTRLAVVAVQPSVPMAMDVNFIAPDHLNAAAKHEFKRVAIFLPDKWRTLFDITSLAMYCDAYSKWVAATIRIRT